LKKKLNENHRIAFQVEGFLSLFCLTGATFATIIDSLTLLFVVDSTQINTEVVDFGVH